jgi:hypothetical protein
LDPTRIYKEREREGFREGEGMDLEREETTPW